MKTKKQYQYWIESIMDVTETESCYTTADRSKWLSLISFSHTAIAVKKPADSTDRNLFLRHLGESQIWIVYGHGWTCEAEYYVFDNAVDAFDKFLMLTEKDAKVK